MHCYSNNNNNNNNHNNKSVGGVEWKEKTTTKRELMIYFHTVNLINSIFLLSLVSLSPYHSLALHIYFFPIFFKI